MKCAIKGKSKTNSLFLVGCANTTLTSLPRWKPFNGNGLMKYNCSGECGVWVPIQATLIGSKTASEMKIEKK